jgi:hypothetical protein
MSTDAENEVIYLNMKFGTVLCNFSALGSAPYVVVRSSCPQYLHRGPFRTLLSTVGVISILAHRVRTLENCTAHYS